MIDKKLTGSFYTPKVIADFMVEYVNGKARGKKLSVLEPSSGDGSFIKSIFDNKAFFKKIHKIVAVEKDEAELEKVRAITQEKKLQAINEDFLKFQDKNDDLFSIVIGNPPYIKKNILDEEQVKRCEAIHKEYSILSDNKIKNIWTAFLVRSIRFVDKYGVLALVLPAELLQVNFASELRLLILSEFERVEIFTFNELLFADCKGQDTMLLIAERRSENKGVYYCNINKAIDLEEKGFTLAQNLNIRDSKWMHHHLTTDEIELLEKVKGRLKKMDSYCHSKAGIVTAANNFFIVDRKIVSEFSLQNFIKPIIQKGAFVNGSVILTQNDFDALVSNKKPAYLIALNKASKFKETDKINTYLNQGIVLEIDKRYKTSIRENWYEVPNIGLPPEAFFFKRCNEYPKLIKNDADVLSTDSAYVISMRDGFNINSLIFSFYNSLTLSFAELNGRYYGGGVLELTPNEFKSLPIPYLEISDEVFEAFAKGFKSKSSIGDICKLNDKFILQSILPDLDDNSINLLFQIRKKLFSRRMKTS